VLLDWRIPEMDGIEMVDQLRKQEIYPLPALVLVTAHGREDVIRHAATAGIDQVLLKPVSIALLLDTLNALLGSGTVRLQQSVARQTPLPDLSGRHLLLVEDNDLNRQVAEELLLETRCRVSSCAHDGQ